jgi:hypothetical protein
MKALTMVLILWCSEAAGTLQWQALAPAQAPQLNPLSGFVPFDGDYSTFPYSLEYFYLPVSAVQQDYAHFEWTALENKLNGIAERGHHAIFRLFYDYPNRTSGIPAFLSHVPTFNYTEHDNGSTATSVCPDYEHPDLKRALFHLIEALGSRYDGDPRIGFLELGLIGFWGEWHTWPHPEWMPAMETQNAVIQAFDLAFNETRLLMREPRGQSPLHALGYHDDSFVYNTHGDVSWYHYPKLVAAAETDKWKTEPMGGELRPEIQVSIWNSDALEAQPSGGPVQNWNTSVALTHPSWMMVWKTFWPGLSGAAKDRALEAARGLGYTFCIEAWAFLQTSAAEAQCGVRIRNDGIAPFYYPWTFELGFFQNGVLRKLEAISEWDPRRIESQSTLEFMTLSCPLPETPGTYTLALRIRNPLPNGLPLRFANQNPAPPEASWQVLGAIPINHPPQLNAIGNRSVEVGQNLSIPIQASDADLDTLSFSASGD